MIQQAKEKTWKDVDGIEVPKKYIDRITQKTERVLSKVINKTLLFQKKAMTLKDEIITECDELYLEMMKAADVEIKERKGNYSIFCFDRSIKAEMKISDRIEVDEKMNFAHEKIKEFLALKTKNADEVLTVLVNGAFNAKTNKVNVKDVLKMFRYKIKDKLWVEAMDLAKESIHKNKSVRYLAIYQKNPEGKYEQIQLNFSAL